MIRFSFKNVLGQAVATSGDPSNLRLTQPSKVWKTTNKYTNLHMLSYSFPLQNVSCLGLFNLTLNAAATIYVGFKRGGVLVKTITLTAAPIIYGYGEGPYGLFAYGGYYAPGRAWLNRFRVLWFEDTLADSMDISFDGTDSVSLGYVHLGPSWSPPVGPTESYHSTFQLISKESARSVGGSSTGSLSRTYREISVELQLLAAQDVDFLLKNIDNYKPIIFGAYVKEKVDTEALYGTLLCKAPAGVQMAGSIRQRFNVANLVLEEIK